MPSCDILIPFFLRKVGETIFLDKICLNSSKLLILLTNLAFRVSEINLCLIAIGVNRKSALSALKVNLYSALDVNIL